jgi:hypothetical protein
MKDNQQKQYPKLKDNCDCTLCLGCNLLEMPWFTGKNGCPNYMSGFKQDKSNTYGSETGDNY